MNKLLMTIAAVLVAASAAQAADEGYPGAVERGTSRAGSFTADGVPIILPWVSDRTARRYGPRPNWQPGPFRDGASR